MTTDLSTYNNDWYQPGSAAKRACWYMVSLLFFKPSFLPFYGFKVFLLRLFGARVGKGVVIKPGVQVKYPWLLRVGNHCWLGEKVWIDNLAQVTISDHVCLSQGAFL
ncbi:MAG: colanic acid biosynthesis acetyltransferase WcaF, partial [Chitinophagaceae bacterium]